MIIGFAGRCRSGKSELAKVCERHGYQKISFADPLKQLCSNILGVSLDELNELKTNKATIDFTINEDVCDKLSKETDIPLPLVRQMCLGYVIHDVRHMLQFIGTDIIRRYNSDWHVNKTKDRIKPDLNYVIDDVRFPNEKKMIDELGGDCWFITRTTLDNITNHESETSLTWHLCWDKIIVNDSTLEYLIFRWETFIENYEKSLALRKEHLKMSLENCVKDEIIALSTVDVLLISECMYTYVPKDFEEKKIKSAKMNEDNSVTITYTDGTLEFIENQLQIEDLKLYL